MATIKNTSYKVQADINTDAERLEYKIEEGAYVTTSSGAWTVWNGEWVKLYPQDGPGTGTGWVRYDDTQYTSSNKLTVAAGTTITLPNNGGNIIRSHDGVDYYNPATQTVLGQNMNNLFLATVVLRASCPNANQGYGHIMLTNTVGTPYERLHGEFIFPKGNDVPHDVHRMFQYYVDADFMANGSKWQIAAEGDTLQIWDIIFFFSKIQSYA